MRLRESPSQTAGPYVHIGLAPTFAGLEGVYPADLGSGALCDGGVRGERITIEGNIIDGSGGPIADALVEIWQADADGLFQSPNEPRGRADRNAVRADNARQAGALILRQLKIVVQRGAHGRSGDQGAHAQRSRRPGDEVFAPGFRGARVAIGR